MQLRLLLGLLLSCLCLRAASLGSLGFTPPVGWHEVSASQPDQPKSEIPTIRFAPQNDRNASVLISAMPAGTARDFDTDKLKDLHQSVCASSFHDTKPIFDTSEFPIKAGIGFETTYEDPDLIGKPPVPGNCKFATVVTVLLHKEFLIVATIFADTKRGTEYEEAVRAIHSATLRPGSAASTTASAFFEISLLPELHATLRVPRASFKESDLRTNRSPNYFIFNGKDGLIFSGWLDAATGFPGMKKFWENEKKGLRKGGFSAKNETFRKIGDWEAVSYVIDMGQGMEQKNLRVCRILGDTWADLHLSSGNPDAKWSDLEAVLQIVIFAPLPSKEL